MTDCFVLLRNSELELDLTEHISPDDGTRCRYPLPVAPDSAANGMSKMIFRLDNASPDRN